jgi:hypothetical protein
MPLKFCPRCTIIEEGSERSYSPELESPRTVRELPPTSRDALPDGALVTGSRNTSPLIEDLRDIQRIFEEVNAAEVDQVQTRDSDSFKNSPRKSIIGSLFRKTIMRTKSKSTGMLLSDADELERNKSDLKKTLLTGQSRDAGGYDSDAAVLGDIDTPATLQVRNNLLERSRGKIRQEEGWPPR